MSGIGLMLMREIGQISAKNRSEAEEAGAHYLLLLSGATEHRESLCRGSVPTESSMMKCAKPRQLRLLKRRVRWLRHHFLVEWKISHCVMVSLGMLMCSSRDIRHLDENGQMPRTRLARTNKSHH